MAKTADQSQVFLYDLGGETVEVAREHRDAFLRENPKAQGVGLYDAGGETFEVADSDLEAFRAANPTAERVHLFDDPGGETVEVSRRDIGAYIGSRAQQAQKANDARLAETSKARAKERADRLKAAAQADLRAKVGENPLAPTTQIGHGLQDAAAGIAYALPRLAGAVADAVNPDPLKRRDVITGQTVRVSPEEAGYAEDPYRPGPAARLRDRIEESEARRLAESAPKTKAGERARAIAGAAGGMGALALSGGAAAPLLAVETGAGAMQREAAKGATPAEQAGAFALGTGLGALATAAGGAPGRAAGRAVQGAALRAGAAAGAPVGSAVTRAVVAGNAARGAVQGAVDMAALRAAENAAAGDPLLEGTGSAALGGALVGGAVRGVSSVPGARYIGSAAERAAAERGGAPTPPRGAEAPAGISAPRPISPEDATPSPPATPARPLPGGNAGSLPAPAEPGAVPDAVRGYVPPAERALGDREAAARRSAKEELAPAEVPQVPVDEVPPTVAPEARPGNAGNAGSEAPASGGASRPGEPVPAGEPQDVVLVRGGLRIVGGAMMSHIDRAVEKPANERTEFEDDIVRVLNMPTRERALNAINEMGHTGPEAYGIDVDTGMQALLISAWEKRHAVSDRAIDARTPEPAPAEPGEVARIEAEARFDEEPVAGSATPPPNNSEHCSEIHVEAA